MIAKTVAVLIYVPPSRVIESKNKNFVVGDLVVSNFGWCTHTISTGDAPVRKIDPSIPLRASTALGILGMPG